MKTSLGRAPSISVVLPVYNRATYVCEAIESVLAQTLPPDELIVVDDGSTDDSVAVVERFARPGLHVIRQENAGIGAARNRGLGAATGELIAFIDSDDLWERDKLELQVAALRDSDDVQLVFGHLVEFLSPDRVEELSGSLRVGTAPVPGLMAITLLARRAAVDRIGPFDEELRVGEFVEWMARAHDLGLASRMLSEVVARRRIHGGNTVLTRSNTDYLRAIKSTLDRRRRAANAADARPTVAALVPVWNGAAFLAEALESILAQEPAADEVVVIDDGSTDGSGEIARGFGPRVRCVRQENGGLATARNAAIRESRSDLIAFLDADDVWPRGRLARLLRALETNPDCGIAQGRLQRMVRNDQTTSWQLVNESWRAPNVATALIRRSAFTLVGPFDASVAGGDDVDWLLRAKELGVRETHVEEITLHYRRHGGNMTNDVATDQSRLLHVLGRAVARRRTTGATARKPTANPGERS